MDLIKQLLLGLSELAIITSAIIIAYLLIDYKLIKPLTGGTKIGALILAIVLSIVLIALKNWQETQK